MIQKSISLGQDLDADKAVVPWEGGASTPFVFYLRVAVPTLPLMAPLRQSLLCSHIASLLCLISICLPHEATSGRQEPLSDGSKYSPHLKNTSTGLRMCSVETHLPSSHKSMSSTSSQTTIIIVILISLSKKFLHDSIVVHVFNHHKKKLFKTPPFKIPFLRDRDWD